MAAEHSGRAPRRAPSSDERGKAAERTRRRILEAAVKEFGAKGYAGARTAGIAARAGVNQQLISYYFGGKKGLLDALREQWSATEKRRVNEESTYEQTLATYLDATLDHPEWARLVIWRALGDLPDDDDDGGAVRERTRTAVERVRRRQENGEISADLDPAFVLLLSYVLTFAPISIPDHVEGITGFEPLSPDYRAWVQEQLIKLVKP